MCGACPPLSPTCAGCLEWLLDAGSETKESIAVQQSLEEFGYWAEDESHESVGPAYFFVRLWMLYQMLQHAACGEYRLAAAATRRLSFLLAYVAAPLDLIPDFIPIAGWTDDAALLTVVLGLLSEQVAEYMETGGLSPAYHGLRDDGQPLESS